MSKDVNRLRIRPICPWPALCLCAMVLCVLAGAQQAEISETRDAEYIARFQAHFKKVDPPPTLERQRLIADYDGRFMGDSLARALENVHNDTGGLAWGLADRMMSLNDMYRVTGDVKYLLANLECARAVAAATDDKRGKTLWHGVVAKAWGCDKYAPQRGRAVFAVHTGLIVYPMLDLLLLAEKEPDVLARLAEDRAAILGAALDAIAFHDPQWRDGPGDGEGHYIGLNQEPVCDNRPLPGNRLSAIGRGLWLSWKVAGNTTHRDRARAIGRYMKNRMTRSPDGAYYWPYWLPEEPTTEPAPRAAFRAEDTSHAGLTIALPILLAQEGEIFGKDDLILFANTVLKGFGRLGDGILWSDIACSADLDPRYVGSPARYLPLSAYVPAVRDVILAFYTNYRPHPSPHEISLLVQHLGP